MSTKEAARKASSNFHAKRKAEGWRKVTVWLSPGAAERLEALKEAHGWATDETMRRLLTMGDLPAEPSLGKLLADNPIVLVEAKAGKVPEARAVKVAPAAEPAEKAEPKSSAFTPRADTYPAWMKPAPKGSKK